MRKKKLLIEQKNNDNTIDIILQIMLLNYLVYFKMLKIFVLLSHEKRRVLYMVKQL